MLGHGLGRVGGDMHEGELLPGQMLQVDVVAAGATQSNETNVLLLALVKHGRRHLVIDKGADHVVGLGQRGGDVVQAGFQKGEGVPGGGEKRGRRRTEGASY